MSTATRQFTTTKPDVVGVCPQCGSEVLDGKQKFYCSKLFKGKCRFSLSKSYFKRWGENRLLSKEEMRRLLAGDGIILRNLITKKNGNKFDCEGYLIWIPQINCWKIDFVDTFWHD